MSRSPLASIPAIGERMAPAAATNRWYTRTKEIFDRTLALIGLIVLLPVLALIALAIRLDSSGPILFKQKRFGLDGKPFTMFKFRTMVVNADDAIHRAAVDRFFRAQSVADTGSTTFKLRLDPRITRVGRVLRKTSLDELPQLLNVLNGTMSLVGPRPPVSYEIARYSARHWQRLRVKPGITGPWQVFGRNRVSFEEMIDLDLAYISQRSLLYDLQLLVLTVGAIVSMNGAG